MRERGRTFLRSLLSLAHPQEVVMGRGDQKSRRGKIRRGTYGKKRPHKPKRVKKAKPANEGSIDERLN